MVLFVVCLFGWFLREYVETEIGAGNEVPQKGILLFWDLGCWDVAQWAKCLPAKKKKVP